ncbi:Alanine--glyoxylate aminotransferase 1 [Neolecta irregularis DAH-3]|uniref:alanine--glyoxylate transaminase n=1 Tax=Neolecta irregularis (strain DAH-3) TaxID=1198029 RepID=A0A1U7LJQ4_NEOID|nr:Alanine--glyoxylate aminotransferase 1 [Neolecta irregularis DAH-3]|eukprot:OLL22896.1 Alanine--glyoxylate aminotransferase 1 [Neolecta irregularis DAH-3]
MSTPTQKPHPLLMIPGPIEFSDEVLQANAHPSMSHVSPQFVEIFGSTLELLRKVFLAQTSAQPFIISGSGTLGWDFVAGNLVERDEHVLVLHTGYFADSFAECFETYGVRATQLKAPIGARPSLEEIECALKQNKYKIITITHVDTSTGVLSDVKGIAALVKNVSPETLVVVDGVCSIGSEELLFEEWGIDFVLTASQKALGAPPGLCILMAGERAMDVFHKRRSPPSSYYASLKKWLPIMQSYESRKPAYFATPNVQTVCALNVSLEQILETSMPARFEAHKAASKMVKAAVERLGLKQLTKSPHEAANGMTAIWLPESVNLADILPKLVSKGIVFAGGLHKETATRYFRIGHMGITVTNLENGFLDKAIKGLEETFYEIQKCKV